MARDDAKIADMLMPDFGDKVLLVKVHHQFVRDKDYYHSTQEVKNTLGAARNKISNEINRRYGGDKTSHCDWAIYSWNQDDGWSLQDYIPQGTPLNDLSWRSKYKKKETK